MKLTRIPKGETGPVAEGAEGAGQSQSIDNRSSKTWLWQRGAHRGSPSETQRGTHALQWRGAKDTLTVAGLALKAPSVYASQGPPSVPEASCINTELEVGPPAEEDAAALGYWPQYANLSPGQRGNYLKWLAGGKSAPLEDAGYAFLFFFGLERRALVDGEDPEVSVRGLLRLVERQGHLLSFFDHASRFITYLFAKKGIRKLTETWFQRIFIDRPDALHEDSLVVAMTWLYERGLPLPGALAYEVARQDVRSSNSVIVKRFPSEFRRLFMKKYEEQFKEGIRLEVSEIARAIVYRPASPSLQDWQLLSSLRSVDIPDVLRVTSQFMPLVRIWSQCIEELRPLAEALTPEAYEALSPGRRAEVDHPEKSKWDSLVEKHMDSRGLVLFPVSEIAELEGIEARVTRRLTLRESLRLATTARDAGFYLVPHPRTILRPYDWEETVALSRCLEESSPTEDQYYLAAAFMLELGIAMACADGVIEKVEVLHVSDIVNAQFHFSDDDRRRLGTFRSLLLKDPPSLSALGRRVTKLMTVEELEGLGEFLVGVAASNGVIEASEDRALRRAYRSFGVPTGKLDRLLSDLQGSPESTPETADGRAAIDRAVLNRIMADTARVAVLIGTAMGELRIEEDTKDPEKRLPIGLPQGLNRSWAEEYLDDDAGVPMDEDHVTFRLQLVDEDE